MPCPRQTAVLPAVQRWAVTRKGKLPFQGTNGCKGSEAMNPIQAVFSAFRNYGNLDGRASRSEYWWFYLFFVVFLVAIFVACLVLNPALLAVWVAYLVVMAPPLWSVTVRRLHDVGRSGRWALIGFMPMMGGPRHTRLLMRPGTRGPNRYGPDPLRPELGGWQEWDVLQRRRDAGE